MDKPERLLSATEQVAYLKKKGVGFGLMDEAAARAYLTYHNNYFKLTAYRKNYQQHPGGAKAGQYVRLDFAYLVDLAEIDMELRYAIMQLALDVEHHTKLALLRRLEAANENGFAIVAEYRAALNDKDRRILDDELRRSRQNVYCGDMAAKYAERPPVWVFLELISFGKILSFYKFVADKLGDSEMRELFYCLLDCKSLRNAAAHNSCILNDLSASGARRTNEQVVQALTAIAALPKGLRRSKLRCERLRQLATLLYTHQHMVTSSSLRQREARLLHNLTARVNMHSAYYADNDQLRTSFAFVACLVDNWYPLG